MIPKIELSCSDKGYNNCNVTEETLRDFCFQNIAEGASPVIDSVELYSHYDDERPDASLWISPAANNKGILAFRSSNGIRKVACSQDPSLTGKFYAYYTGNDLVRLKERYHITREEMFNGAVYFLHHQQMDPRLHWDLFVYDLANDDFDEENDPIQWADLKLPAIQK